MKKETKKEIGKLLLDLGKIIFAIAVLTPVVKGNNLNNCSLLLSFCLIVLGTIIFNKGVENE